MQELIYGGKDVERKILAEFPEAKIIDASDDVHWDRFDVSILHVSEEDFYIFAMVSGFSMLCLKFRLLCYGVLSSKERKEEIESWMDKAKMKISEMKAAN